MKTYKRRHYFIDRRYQGWIVIKIIMICAFGMSLALATFNYLTYGKIEALRWSIHLSADTIHEIMMTNLIYSSAAAVLVTVVVLYLYLQNMMHKTSGPIYRLKKDLEIAGAGDLSLSIWLRKEDDFKDTAVELNRMIESLRSDFKVTRERFAEVSGTVAILEYIADKPDLSVRKCQQIIDTLETLKKTGK